MKKIISMLIAAAVGCALLPCPLAAGRNLIYVSPSGDDSGDGTIGSPFKTVERAKAAVREINSDMTGDIIVNLCGGTYYLDKTLEFSEEDSGSNGFYVTYRAYGNKTVRVSGGNKIEGWKRYNNKVWRAEYDGSEYVRQLYVNGRRAERAQSGEFIETEAFFDDAKSGYEHSGIVVSDNSLQGCRNPEDIQLHYVIGWKSYLLNVEGIEKYGGRTRIKLRQPAFEAAYKNNQHYIEPGINFRAENVFEELDEPGEFYYDRRERMLYYYPRSGEDMKNADACAARLEVLMNIEGTDANHRAHNINFEGIIFENGAWERPSVAGLVNDQAQMMAPDPTDAPGMLATVPANIRLNRAEKINFRNNVIRDMGCVGIGLFNGVRNCDFRGNVLCDIADSAMTVGNEFFMYDDDVYKGKDLLQNAVITASSWDGANYPIKASDNDTFSVWSPVGDGPCWLQADLGAEYGVDRIVFEPRDNMPEDSALWGIRILGADNPEFIGSTVIAVSAKSSAKDKDGNISLKCRSGKKFRYIRFEKDYYMCLASVRVINESIEYSPKTELCRNNSIENNYITRVGLVNLGAPGIQAYYTQNTSICHNEVYYVPYSGICSGWGWTLYDRTDCRDNKINYNRIDECMLAAFDGGATYMLGNQPNSTQIGNYITNQKNDLAALYLDAGSKNFTLKDNVLDGVPSSYHCAMGGYNIWENNHTTSIADSIDFTQCVNSRAERSGEIYAPGSEPIEVLEIMENAGLEAEYKAIRAKAGENLLGWSREFMLQNARVHAGYGDTADAWYSNYYVKFTARSIKKWLSLVRTGDDIGMYPEEAAAELSAFADECIKITEKIPVSRAEITETYWKIAEKINEFKARRNWFSADAVIAAAKDELAAAGSGNSAGISTQANYNLLEKYLERAEKSRSDADKLMLEAVIVNFRDNKINYDIKAFEVDGQIGDAVIDSGAATVDVKVKYTRDITGLSARAAVNELVKISPNPAAVRDYTRPVSFAVGAKNSAAQKVWTVNVTKESIISDEGVRRITSAAADADGWNTFGSFNNSIYKNERYGDITLDFDMEIAEKANDWPCLVFRSQESDLSFDNAKNSAYVMVFGKDRIEFHRFNNGVRTQFYGAVPGIEPIFGAPKETAAFKFGQKNSIKLTTRNTDAGVYIKFEVNGEPVFDFTDSYDGAIVSPGYLGTVSPGAKVNITAD